VRRPHPTFYALLWFGLMGGARAANLGDLDAAAPRPVVVRVLNLSALPLFTIERGAALAQEIYDRSQVATVWIACSAEPDPAADPRCETNGRRPWEVFVRVLPRAPGAGDWRAGQSALGSAAIPPGGDSFLANAFADRAQALSDVADVDLEVVMGHVLAHEAGHLLLDDAGHGRKGLMQAVWPVGDLRLSARRAMSFTAREETRLHRNAARRRAGR